MFLFDFALNHRLLPFHLRCKNYENYQQLTTIRDLKPAMETVLPLANTTDL